MSDDDTLYPFEVVLHGVPVSLQTKNPRNKDAWKERVSAAARERQRETYELGFLDDRPLAVTIHYFPSDPMAGDIDNIVKPIMDAMIGIAYLDDRTVERVSIQKFEPDGGWEFQAPSDRLTLALDAEPPVVYIRVDDDLGWRVVR